MAERDSYLQYPIASSDGICQWDFLADALALEDIGEDLQSSEFLGRQEDVILADSAPQLEDLPLLRDPIRASGHPEQGIPDEQNPFANIQSSRMLEAHHLRMPPAPATLSSINFLTSFHQLGCQEPPGHPRLWETAHGEVGDNFRIDRPVEVSERRLHLHQGDLGPQMAYPSAYPSPFSSRTVQDGGQGVMSPNLPARIPLSSGLSDREFQVEMDALYGSSAMRSDLFQARHSAPPHPSSESFPRPALRNRGLPWEGKPHPLYWQGVDSHLRRVSDPSCSQLYTSHEIRRNPPYTPDLLGVIKQPMKHSRLQPGPPPSSMTLTREARSKSDTVRVVSGRGEFDYLTKKGPTNDLTQKKYLLQVRSNQLWEPVPPPSSTSPQSKRS